MIDAVISFCVGILFGAFFMAWYDRRTKGPKKSSGKPAGSSPITGGKGNKTKKAE